MTIADFRSRTPRATSSGVCPVGVSRTRRTVARRINSNPENTNRNERNIYYPPPRIQIEITPEELDTLCAGLGKLRRRIVDRIKNNRRHLAQLEETRDAARIAAALNRHIQHNTGRLEEVDALLNRLNETK